MNITMVLPGRNRHGGTRAAMEMANAMLHRGHDVRIACCAKPPWGSRRRWRLEWDRVSSRMRGIWHDDWVRDFEGPVLSFRQLEDIGFRSGEAVIAVGTYTVRAVHELSHDVVKLRWCVGLTEYNPERMRSAWSIPMPTISASPNLVPMLEQLTGEPIKDIVPLAINGKHYFLEDQPRDGIGTVFSTSPKKAPEDVIAIFDGARRRWPQVPHYVFGYGPRPSAFPVGSYWRLPSVARSRKLYNRARIWIVASRSEGFGLPILEAMACGCVVISTNHDTASVLIRDGENGLLVPVGDVDAVLSRIGQLLGDKSLRQRLVARGLETVDQYTWEQAAGRMECALERIMVNGRKV